VRLTRVGGRKNPIWRVVVADQRSPRDGRIIETVGRYNAQTDPSEIVLDADRLTHWLDRGAQPTSTVKKLMRTQGIGGIGGGATGGSPAVTADDEPATPAANGEAAVSPEADAAPEPEADAPSAADTTPESPEPEASTASEAPAPDATSDADPAEAPDDGSATESPSTS
jgi:small subunit ribosomal protein S16